MEGGCSHDWLPHVILGSTKASKANANFSFGPHRLRHSGALHFFASASISR